MSEFILSKLPELSNNGRSQGIKRATIKQMVRDLLTKERIVKIEVKEMRYTKAQLAKELSIDLEDLQPYLANITNFDAKQGTRKAASDFGIEVLKLYCKTKFSM